MDNTHIPIKSSSSFSSLVSVLLLPLLFCSSLFSVALSGSAVTHLPGFNGPLPFHLETGYVGVDDAQLFYYFIESEKNPREDPLLLWLTGGPGCSAFSGLVFEIGPLKFRSLEYNNSLPSLVYFPDSWTKVSNIIFLDSPVGSGFSFSRCLKDYEADDTSSSKQVYTFLKKWFIEHPQFLGNPFYVAGDSYGGKVVVVIAQEILEGNEAGLEPIINLKGYLIGNPVTGEKIDKNTQVPYAHNMAILSDELYELTLKNCGEEEDYTHPSNAVCANTLEMVNKFFAEINTAHILEPKCPRASPKPKNIFGDRRYLNEEPEELIVPPPVPALKCRSYAYYLSYYWANNDMVREALHIQKGSVGEWERCSTKFNYTSDIQSSIMYHRNIISKGYRALVYSGDHDMVIPHLGTQEWIRSLNLPIVNKWRSWKVGGQVAGYMRTYKNNLTFATVKGAGHTAPEYKPRECLAMVQRWLSHKPL